MNRFFLLVTIVSCVLTGYGQEQLTNLPTLYIVTTDQTPITDTENYIGAKLTCLSTSESDQLSDVDVEIRGRGNSTWRMPKKPFRIKFSKKINFLGLTAKEDDWVLLANYADKTLMRNAVAFEISKIIGLPFTPSVKYVDLVINGEYVGNYMVTDQIEVKADRVNIEKLEPTMTSLPEITGGYLLEADGFAEGNVKFQTAKGMNVVVKYPDEEDINPAQLNYITNYVQSFENALFSSSFKDPASGYRKYLDVPSFVNWYICSELTGNPDSFWSTYFYKERNDPLIKFGPVWDFDIAFNNDRRLGNATRMRMSDAAHDPKQWIRRLLQDPWLNQEIAKRWQELDSEELLSTLSGYVTSTATELNESQQLNFSTWNILGTVVYLELSARGTYANEVKFLKDYLAARMDFLNDTFELVTSTEISTADTWRIFPNPLSLRQKLSVELLQAANLQLEVLDVSGQTVFSFSSTREPGTWIVPLDSAALIPGAYVVRVTAGNEHVYQRKLLIIP